VPEPSFFASLLPAQAGQLPPEKIQVPGQEAQAARTRETHRPLYAEHIVPSVLNTIYLFNIS